MTLHSIHISALRAKDVDLFTHCYYDAGVRRQFIIVPTCIGRRVD
ncbi:hypothetical protein IFVP5_C2280194 [Vibrio parahaemolyticus]